MIIVTGATGQLGRIVITKLLKKVPATEIVALVRDPAKAADLAATGVQVRAANYNEPATLDAAFAGATKVLLISGTEFGQRVQQHRNVIAAAQRAKVELLAYTSVLRADTSPMVVAVEHRETEALIKVSGLHYTILRNSWYTENYTASIPGAVQHGAFISCAGDGKISSAAREDYAEAAVAVLTQPNHAGKIYELGGDEAYTLADLAAEISRQTGKQIPYKNLTQAEYQSALVAAGLPEFLAEFLASSDVDAAKGTLFEGGRQLSQLIGRPTTPLASVVKAALVNGEGNSSH
jgi:NAD(P)H dehydrogenase (quinone)